ncbi:MAG: septal ring lytic transglycosylase RlpA family protein [Lautropia sp.]
MDHRRLHMRSAVAPLLLVALGAAACTSTVIDPMPPRSVEMPRAVDADTATANTATANTAVPADPRTASAPAGAGSGEGPRTGEAPRAGTATVGGAAVDALRTPSQSGASTRISGVAGAYYLDDGPGASPLPDPSSIADATPISEPLHPRANRPYEVFGTNYVPQDARRPFVQRGTASWYGRRFQGKPTSTGEPYDMYAMTAAHPTLPLPSYARITNLENGRSAIVRVNDRGPFLRGRVIDLSMIAAHKLGYLEAGSARVEVRLIDGAAATTPARSSTVEAAAAPPPTETAAAPALARVPERSAVPSGSTVAIASAPAGQHYVQLAAFSSREAADAGRGMMQTRFDWLDRPIRVIGNASVFRVQAGPWPDHAGARAVAMRIEAETGLRPWIVARP